MNDTTTTIYIIIYILIYVVNLSKALYLMSQFMGPKYKKINVFVNLCKKRVNIV